jgi:hypothetical protein
LKKGNNAFDRKDFLGERKETSRRFTDVEQAEKNVARRPGSVDDATALKQDAGF